MLYLDKKRKKILKDYSEENRLNFKEYNLCPYRARILRIIFHLDAYSEFPSKILHPLRLNKTLMSKSIASSCRSAFTHIPLL